LAELQQYSKRWFSNQQSWKVPCRSNLGRKLGWFHRLKKKVSENEIGLGAERIVEARKYNYFHILNKGLTGSVANPSDVERRLLCWTENAAATGNKKKHFMVDQFVSVCLLWDEI
jgi:hypothetical protein